MNCWLCKDETETAHWTNCRLLCAECHGKPRYRYYYLNRPPGTGCQPDGFVDREAWMPGRLIPNRKGDWRALGWVEYLTPLTPEAVWKWEFWPHNGAEVTVYQNWREDNDR